MAHIFTKEEDNAWHKTLPTKHVAVKTIIKDTNGNILLVKPSYRAHWHIPGGGVDEYEDPIAAAVRELAEETGIKIKTSDLVIVDILHRAENDDLNIIYHAKKVVDSHDVTIQPAEIERFEFVAPKDMTKYLSKGMSKWWDDKGE